MEIEIPGVLDSKPKDFSTAILDKKKAPVSLATALAIKVFPEPGGPYNKTPLGGLTPNVLNNCGCLNGNSIISLI